jgi:hypothetical protein
VPSGVPNVTNLYRHQVALLSAQLRPYAEQVSQLQTGD